MSDSRWDAEDDDATQVRAGGAHAAAGDDDAASRTSNMERLSAMFDGEPDDLTDDEDAGDDAVAHEAARGPRSGG